MNLNNEQLVIRHHRMRAACYDFMLFYKHQLNLGLRMGEINCENFEYCTFSGFQINFRIQFHGDAYDISRTLPFAQGQRLLKLYTRVKRTKEENEWSLSNIT